MIARATIALLALLTPLATAAPSASRFTFFDMPTKAAGPCDLCTGPDGALWGEDQLVNKIFRIDSSGKVEEFEIPWTLPAVNKTGLPKIAGRLTFACAIRPGADGNIYASNGIRNQLVQVNPTTKVVKVFTPQPYHPLGDLQPFNDLYTGPNGLFFTQTTDDIIGYFDYATETFKNYKIPTKGGSPLGMFYASDGYAYSAEFLGNKIAKLNPRTGHIQEFPLPASLVGPAVIRVETEGKYIWFTSFLGNGLGRLEMATGNVTAYTNPSPSSFPAEDTKDKYGRVWFSTATQDTLNYFDPKTETFHTIVQPGVQVVAPVSKPFYFEIAVHYGPGNAIWFTQETANRVGRYQLD